MHARVHVTSGACASLGAFAHLAAPANESSNKSRIRRGGNVLAQSGSYERQRMQTTQSKAASARNATAQAAKTAVIGPLHSQSPRPRGLLASAAAALKHALHRAAGQESIRAPAGVIAGHARGLGGGGPLGAVGRRHGLVVPFAAVWRRQGKARRHQHQRLAPPHSNGRLRSLAAPTTKRWTHACGGVCHPVRRATDTQASRRGGPIGALLAAAAG
ncbi:hypothetical protein M409DRAFT_55603 [Zasmidium cellare ATCC 36951]|uniref:Uncharacterized protein n=1 Tax=Zasmidium cellare ATCC 36951 TaxID=1080233 RepID=A0A6A6CID5_ZASCE|nr:uncharacterized protein M409DRAFT_55603 [Zasmidium cellare ATCC 36951]KAF2165722.1 hypothetical protein M409DRAFT_55603 [Zasmidium cellare ATCC 36951]